MSANLIRFAVGSATGPRSAVWSLAWRKSDVYLIAVEIAGIAKISLHLRTGEFKFGYVHEYFVANREDVPGHTRFIEEWPRPPAYDGGITLPLRMYIANEALKPDPQLPTQKTIRWFAPRPGKAVGFTWVITTPEILEDPFPHTDLELVSRLALPEHREPVWFYAHQIDASIVSAAALRSSREFREEVPDLALHAHQRLLGLQNPEPVTGARIFLEVPLPAA